MGVGGTLSRNDAINRNFTGFVYAELRAFDEIGEVRLEERFPRPPLCRTERRAGSGCVTKIQPSKGMPPVKALRSLRTAPGQNTLMMARRW
jgi:hypothetical protein